MHDLTSPVSWVTEPERGVLSCMIGEFGLVWYVLAWIGGLTLPMLLVVGFISVVRGG